MDHYKNYNRCRQFTPPGWGTARTFAPCGRAGRSTTFRAECRPRYGPMIIPANAGMNVARDENVRDNVDPCHGRRFCPPATQAPINVHLKMCAVPNNGSSNEGDFDRCSGQFGGGQANYGRTQTSSAKDPYCEQCPNTCPLPRCPPGVKVERTMPIIPKTQIQESYFKMQNASVYKSDYVPREIELTPSFAPERTVVESQGEFQQQSLTKADYHPHPVCPYKKPPWAFRKAREENFTKMDGISRYKIDYVPKNGMPAPSAKPERFLEADPPPMDDKTVYQVEYIPHPLPSRLAKLTKKQMLAEITSTCVPFDGLTVYKRDYIPKRGKPAISVMDKEGRYMRTLLPMEGITTYKAAYEPFYFGDVECIPAEIYDQMYPPKDKCCDVRCYPEAERELENPVQDPVPPCQPQAERPYYPTPYEMRCSPRVVPCVSPYKLRKEGNNSDGCTTIHVEHNVNRECQSEPIEYVCPAQPCKPSY